LRNRLSTPYKALQVYSTRLQKLQVANDVLRRVARFFMLSRRLEAQMNMINTFPSSSTPTKNETNGTSTLSPTPLSANSNNGVSGNEEAAQERERTIIKAALSIAEICRSSLFTQAPIELTMILKRQSPLSIRNIPIYMTRRMQRKTLKPSPSQQKLTLQKKKQIPFHPSLYAL
jgi:hypothetical protein